MRVKLKIGLLLIFGYLTAMPLQGQCLECSMTNPTNISTIPNNSKICITNSTTWNDISIGDNVKICIAPGSTLTINNNLTTTNNHNLTIDVWGTLRFAQKPTFRSNLFMTVRAGGEFISGTVNSPNDLEFSGSKTNVYNSGQILTNVLGFQNNSSVNEIENSSSGLLDIRANININGVTDFQNFGELRIQSSYNNNATSTYTNCGVINALTGFNLGGGLIVNSGVFNHGTGQMDLPGNSRLENYGELTSLGTINGGSNGRIVNEGLLKITTIQPNGMRISGPEGASSMGYVRLINRINPNGAKVGPNLNFESYQSGFNVKSSVQGFAQIFSNTPVYVNASGNTTTAELANVRFDCEATGNCSGTLQTYADCSVEEYFDYYSYDGDDDGIPDFMDDDADNDGIPNNVECPPVAVTLNNFYLLNSTGISNQTTNFQVGSKLIRKSVTMRGGVEYDAIATIISINTTGGANFGLVEASRNFAIRNGISRNHNFMHFKIEFVKSGTVNTSNDLIVPQTLQGVTIIMKDVDGNQTSQHFTDVVGYKTNSNPSSVQAGSLLTNLGFTSGGPGSSFTYYRGASYQPNTFGVVNAPVEDENYWVQVSYDHYTSNEFVFGITGTRSEAIGERASVVDGAFSLASCDTDGDGIPNFLDLDSDNDGIPDILESGGVDADGNGIADDVTDANGNGIPDIYDVLVGGTSLGNLDSDGDGVPNHLDLDSDNDGIPDYIEALPQATYVDPSPYTSGVDTNGDGWIDSYVGNQPVDTDNDGIPDYLDLDSDNDGIFDLNEFTYDGNTLPDANQDGRVDSEVGENGLVDLRDTADDYDNPNGDISDPIQLGGDANGNGIWDYREIPNSCTKPPVGGQPDGFSAIGITTHSKPKKDWPFTDPNGFISLESSNKGFVITRVQHVSFNPNPSDSIDRLQVVEGMLVYDIQDACVKLYNGTNWSCIQKCQ